VKVVVDTNIVFSALLNANSEIHEVLLNPTSLFEFYSPELMLEELEKYSSKLISLSKLSNSQMKEAKSRLLRCVTLISEEVISENSWLRAYELTKDVDENDTPFLALSIELNCPLWTGDKKLIEGVKLKGFDSVMNTRDILNWANSL
jgi:predicted nucleic acid-binding protein